MWAALEALAAALGLAGVWWMARQRRVGWSLAGLSALFYVVLLWHQQLPGQALVNGLYLALQAYGWWHWGRATEKAVVRRLPLRYWALGLVVVVGFGLSAPGWAAVDRSVAAGSVLAQLFTAWLYLECWLWWMVLDSAAVALYLAAGLWLTAGLYVIYTGLAVHGWLSWREPPPPRQA